MLNIEKKIEGSKLVMELEGKIDTITAPEIEAEVKGGLDGIDELVFDFAKVDYISSAGLRVLLLAQKTMSEQGKMIVKNCGKEVLEIFEVTGFIDILTVE